MIKINKKLKLKAYLPVVLLGATMLLSGCGETPDVESMKSGLTKSGLSSQQAECFSKAMESDVEGEIYNFLAKALNQGESESNAVNRARRKYGADFKDAVSKARAACVKQ